MCSVETCSNACRVKSSQYCDGHSKRLKQHGTLMAEIPLGGIVRAPRPCNVDGCTERHRNGGYCVKHYTRFKRYGDPLGMKPKPPKAVCNFDTCEKLSYAWGYCKRHYDNAKRRGDAAINPTIDRSWIPQFDSDGNQLCSRCERFLPQTNFGDYSYKGQVSKRKACIRCENLWSAHKITHQQYTELLDSQNGRCSCCGVEQCISGREFSVDHDHSCCPDTRSCGKCIRGLLCGRCNMGLGQFNDSISGLREAIAYLEEAEKRGPWVFA